MRHFSPICFLLLLCGLSLSLPAQDDLLGMLEDMEEETTEYTYATFKTVRIINGHSIETPAPGVMQLLISHRFGRVNGGAYEFFGLDQANMRLGFEYGISNHLCVGIGRSNIQKTYDSFVKVKFLRQSTGKRVMPITLAYLGTTAANTLRWADPSRTNYFASRLSFTHQLLLARKFSDRLSLQLMPTLVHRNLVETADEKNSVLAIGAGGRVRLTGSLTVNFEYFYVLPDQLAPGMQNSAAIGFDIETGGHVFQLMFTNSRGMSENLFLTQTDGKIDAGDIHFGFNLARVFTVARKKPKKSAEEAW
jgi:opacity protein-like surface antigen